LLADEHANARTPHDAADKVAEVGAVLEGGEDAAHLLALRELRRGQDVQEAVAEDLLDLLGVELAHRAEDPVHDAARDPGDGTVSGDALLEPPEAARDLDGGQVGEVLVDEGRG